MRCLYEGRDELLVCKLTRLGIRILRPSFFTENFDGYIGSIAFSVLKTGLKPSTKLSLIVSRLPNIPRFNPFYSSLTPYHRPLKILGK
jgi:hypothetical protein